jgi:hypothetical protein
MSSETSEMDIAILEVLGLGFACAPIAPDAEWATGGKFPTICHGWVHILRAGWFYDYSSSSAVSPMLRFFGAGGFLSSRMALRMPTMA